MIASHSVWMEKEMLIEVKTTNKPDAEPFYISANELRCSEAQGAFYWLYHVFDFNKPMPRLYRLTGPLGSKLDLRGGQKGGGEECLASEDADQPRSLRHRDQTTFSPPAPAN
jgi:hypothetical protein